MSVRIRTYKCFMRVYKVYSDLDEFHRPGSRRFSSFFPWVSAKGLIRACRDVYIMGFISSQRLHVPM